MSAVINTFCFNLCEHLQLLKTQASLPLSQTVHKRNHARIDDVQKQVTELCGNRLTYGRKCGGPTFLYWLCPVVTGLWKWSSFNGSPWERKRKKSSMVLFYSLRGSCIHVIYKDPLNQYSAKNNAHQNLWRGLCHSAFICLLNLQQQRQNGTVLFTNFDMYCTSLKIDSVDLSVCLTDYRREHMPCII